jgi:hypothetical protein
MAATLELIAARYPGALRVHDAFMIDAPASFGLRVDAPAAFEKPFPGADEEFFQP